MGAFVIRVPERLTETHVRSVTTLLESYAARESDVVVLEGAPETFCIGMDFTTVETDVTRLALFGALLRATLLSPRPTLAVIDGPALGGGLGIAAACDYVLATDRARFGLPEALYGLAPAIIRPALMTRLTSQQLRLLVLSCHSRSALEAKALTLVDEIASLATLDLARRTAIRQLGRARTETVLACRRWDAIELDAQLATGIEETTLALSSPQVLAALRAFTADEDPPWL